MAENPPKELRVRTKEYALRIIRLYRSLPHSGESGVIGKQILRSGTSVGAQYREAYRAKSPRDFINKMEGSLQELDETAFWIELLIEAEIMPEERMAELAKETDELIAIFVASIKTAKKNSKT
ncbi:MAG: four helix bundle protein [Chloroflexi bacterium]|jgi:four helix bundle protein|nr:four helix bundle protein [Chloroflexota bacterium]